MGNMRIFPQGTCRSLLDDVDIYDLVVAGDVMVA